jgi:AcrR family transcriptional regulator
MRHPTESEVAAVEAADTLAEAARPVRRAPRQSRARRLTEVVLQATAEVLRARGLAGLSTNEVARQACVSVGAIYQYFPDKAALLVALRQRHANEMGDAVYAAWRDAAPASLSEAVAALVRGLFAAHALDPTLHAQLEAEAPFVDLPPREAVADTASMWGPRGVLAGQAETMTQPGGLWACWRSALAGLVGPGAVGVSLDVAAWVSLQMADGLAHSAWVTASQRPLPFAVDALEAAAVQAVQAYLGRLEGLRPLA